MGFHIVVISWIIYVSYNKILWILGKIKKYALFIENQFRSLMNAWQNNKDNPL